MALKFLYILNEQGEPVQAKNEMEWILWMENEHHIKGQIKHTTLPDKVTVSTVFISIAYVSPISGDPVLFETMIFGGKHDQKCFRYKTKQAAIDGHIKAVAIASGEEADG